MGNWLAVINAILPVSIIAGKIVCAPMVLVIVITEDAAQAFDADDRI
jgi:hypothetical protein